MALNADNLPTEATASGMTVTYKFSDGKTKRVHGSHPNRDNNPGNLIKGSVSIKYGSIGKDRRFAIFPDAQNGWNALIALLKGPVYQQRTITQAIESYAPRKENNTDKYISEVCRVTGHQETDKLSSFDHAQILTLARTIAKIEGWKGEDYKGK